MEGTDEFDRSIFYTVSSTKYTLADDESGQASLDLHQVDNASSSPIIQTTEPKFPPAAPSLPRPNINVTKSLNPDDIERARLRALPINRLTKETKTFDQSRPSSDIMYQTAVLKRTGPLRLESISDSMLDMEFARELHVSAEEPSFPSTQLEAISLANKEVSSCQKILLKRQMGRIYQHTESSGKPNRMTSTDSKSHTPSITPGNTSAPGPTSFQSVTTDSMNTNESIPLLEKNEAEIDIDGPFDGHIHFPTRQGNKDASYLSLPSGPIPDNLIVSLMEKWRLPIPTIILSLPGNAQLSNNSRFRQVLKDNFIRIAATTKVWFLTDGVNKSISAFLGSCLQSHAYKKCAKREQNQRDYLAEYDSPVPIIGLVCPENVYKGELLLTTKEETSITYSRASLSITPDRDLLDMNHSHFILMRDFKGSRSTADWWYSIEDKLSKHASQGKYTLPVVRIIVDNTLQVIDKVSQAVDKDVVTVVISNNQLMRLTHDFIFRLAARDQKKGAKEQEKFLGSCRHFLGSESDSRINEVIREIQTILGKCHLVTMFDMNLTYGADLSKAIVVALLKSKKSTGKAKLKEALGLVIDWNRVDLAEQEIFTESLTWGDADLFQHFFKVLDLNQIEFLDLMLERNVVDIASFVEHNLERLYFNSTAFNNQSPLFNKLIELANIKTYSRLSIIDKLCNKRSSNQQRESILLTPLSDKLSIVKIGELINFIMERSFESIYEKSDLEQKVIKDNPVDNLFIWAILTQRWKMAEVLLNYSNYVIFNAVAAKGLVTGMYKRLKDIQVVSESELEVLKAVSNKFELTAVGVMEETYRRDNIQAHRILQQRNELFDDNNCIEIAVTGHCMTFLSHPCVQSLLDSQWKEPLYRHNPIWKKLLAMLFPFLIFILIDFTNPKPVYFIDYLRFYTSPSVKFITYVLSFILYLLLYSYVVLFQWYPFPSLDACEWVFIAWSVTYVIEEFRQLFGGNGKIKKRVFGYFRDRWNQFDTAFVICFLVGTAFRLIPQIPLEYSRHMFAIFGFFLFFRILQFLIILRESGPFVYMVFRMLRNLTHFVVLAFVFLLAYGVPSQALLYPNVPRNGNSSYRFVIGNIFFKPYFQAFGEFFIEHIAANSNADGANFGNSNPEIYLSSKVFVYIFLLVWIILSNILLVNLIIAKFNNTFVEIESNAAVYWKYKFFNSVSEFRDKPILPPPFNVFEIVFRCVKKVVMYFLRCRHSNTREKAVCDFECHMKKLLFEHEKKCVLAWKFNMELTHERNIEDRIFCLDNRLMNTQQLLVSVKSKIDSLQWGGDFMFDSERDGFTFQTDNMGSI